MKADVRKRFLAAAERQGWAKADGIVCAVSGGGDSVALLWLMRELFEGKIVAAHLDHCTRDGESHDDADFVKSVCSEWGIECSVKVVDVHHSRMTGESFEMAGRRARYEHFSETAERYGLRFIAVGHNANDVVETQLLNLARGTGLTGLRGIPERRGWVVRPLIDFSRDELRNILRENKVAWHDDFTNNESDYTRNKVRNILIPWIKENLNPGFENVMLGLARQVSRETAATEASARESLEKVSFIQPPAIASWKTCLLKDMTELRLAEMLRIQGTLLGLPTLSRKRTEELVKLIARGGCWRFQWARDIEVCYSNRAIGWLHRADIKNRNISSKNKDENNLPWWAR